jgi:uncharacterized membrane protein
MKAGLVGMTYAAMLVVFLAIDLLWLGVIARRFYLNHLGRFFFGTCQLGGGLRLLVVDRTTGFD